MGKKELVALHFNFTKLEFKVSSTTFTII